MEGGCREEFQAFQQLEISPSVISDKGDAAGRRSGMTMEEKLCPYRPAISRAMSIMRAEKPHSLSYQPKIRTW